MKAKILEKAFSLFITKSYDSVSMRDIQEAAKVSRGAIYHHYKSKEQIYECVINTYLVPLFTTYSTVTTDVNSTLMDAIRASVKERQGHINILKGIVPLKDADFYFFKFVFQAMDYSPTLKETANLLTEKE